MVYRYYAVFESAEDGYYLVKFPDIPWATTYGRDRQHAIEMGAECLQLCLESLLDDEEEIPTPSTREELAQAVANDPEVEGAWTLELIEVEASRDEARAKLCRDRMEKGPFNYFAIFSQDGRATIPDIDIAVVGDDYDDVYCKATVALFEYVNNKLANGCELPKASTLEELEVPVGCFAELISG